MSSNVLPGPDEIERVALAPDAFAQQITGDARLYLAAAYALLMQVSHPTVGAGVRDHSTFEEDPWGRLLRTMDYLYLITLTGTEAADVGRRLREVHKPIKGANPDGSRYHALEPEAYAWVHATLIESTLRSYRVFVGDLSRDQIERFYADWMPLGRLLGIRPGDLPETWAGFEDYFETMVDERLERNETVDRVIRTISKPLAPPIPFLRQLWPVLRIAPARALHVATAGLMTPQVRSRLEVPMTRRMGLEFRVLSTTSRALTPLIPSERLEIGHRHLRWRQAEIAAGPLGSAADEPIDARLSEAA